jgi:transcriptional regulator GlxA family with amidase domain
MLGQGVQQRPNPTKEMAKTATTSISQIEVGIVCDDGTSATGLHGLTELFSLASDFAAARRRHSRYPPIRIAQWRSRNGRVDATCDSCPGEDHHPDVLVLPGNLQATLETTRDPILAVWLRQMHACGTIIAAVCGGVFVLARTGLLHGRQATTHWALHDQFAQEFPDVLVDTDYMVIDYGDVLTAGGVLAWADLGLRIVERLLGLAVMLDTAHYMNVDPPGREQRFYSDFNPRLKHRDHAIVKAQQLLAAKRKVPISEAELAKHACLAPRTFLRRFTKATGMKPLEYQQRLRISRAREMLEITRLGIDEIACRVGYQDLTSFRRVFKRFVGLTPSDYRRRFSGAVAMSEIGATFSAATVRG